MKRLVFAGLVLMTPVAIAPALAAGGGGLAPYTMQTIVTNNTAHPLTFEGQLCSVFAGGVRYTFSPGQSGKISCHNGQNFVAMRFAAGSKRCAVEYWFNRVPDHQVVVTGDLRCELKRISDPWAAYALDVR